MLTNFSKELELMERLMDFRTQYIQEQIRMETGMGGLLFKLGLVEKDDKQLSSVRKRYFSALDQMRVLMVADFLGKKKKLSVRDMMFVAKDTIFDEVSRVREEKEVILKSRGFRGLMRYQLSGWRENVSPRFKMIIGFFVIVLAVTLQLAKIDWGVFLFFKSMVLGMGAIIFLEGIIQNSQRKKSAKLGINRPIVYKQTVKFLEDGMKKRIDYGPLLREAYQRLDEKISFIRTFEKGAEARRYTWAIGIGSLVGAIYFLPVGMTAILQSAGYTLASRLMWFLIPTGAMASAFKSDDASSSVINNGEGASAESVSEYENYVSRAGYDDVILTEAKNEGEVNETNDDYSSDENEDDAQAGNQDNEKNDASGKETSSASASVAGAHVFPGGQDEEKMSQSVAASTENTDNAEDEKSNDDGNANNSNIEKYAQATGYKET